MELMASISSSGQSSIGCRYVVSSIPGEELDGFRLFSVKVSILGIIDDRRAGLVVLTGRCT